MEKAKKKILLIEDDPAQVMMYEIEFAHYGWKLDIATRGADGIKAARELKPDLVLLDMLLGDMNGLDVLKTLKADSATKDIKIVAFTNFFKKGLEEECRLAGALGFWKKSSLTPREVVANVELVLGK